MPNILSQFNSNPHRVYETRVGKRDDGVRIAMWSGDAGYEGTNANEPGHRHRLVMSESGFTFENTVEKY